MYLELHRVEKPGWSAAVLVLVWPNLYFFDCYLLSFARAREMILGKVGTALVLVAGVVDASLNCTVANTSVPQYACPNSSCPVITEFKVGDTAWIWCAVDDMPQPK